MVIDVFENQRKKNFAVEKKTNKKTIGIVSFELGDEIVGIELKYILEIINLTNIIRLYKVPDFLIGLTNLRGQIKPVIDLKLFINNSGEKNEVDKERKGLLLHFENNDAIITVDKIQKVEWIPEEDLREPPDTTPERLKEYTSYLVYTNHKPIVIISGEKILTSEAWDMFKD